jgi:CheY-like chemotaxis protein
MKSRILCVENDPAAVRLIRRQLRPSKLVSGLTTVADGRGALKLLYRGSFDICVLDYALPDMTGVQLCHLIRQIGHTLPIMIFSERSSRIDREKAAAAGANEFVCMPDELAIFSAAVKRLIIIAQFLNANNETLSSLAQSPQFASIAG